MSAKRRNKTWAVLFLLAASACLYASGCKPLHAQQNFKKAPLDPDLAKAPLPKPKKIEEPHFIKPAWDVTTVSRGNWRHKSIALTFDDGPDGEATPKILETLKQYNVRATFFIIGERAKTFQDLLIRIAREGHEIGNHSYSHVNLTHVTKEEAAREISKCSILIEKITGQPSLFFRPPGGRYNKTITRITKTLGLTTVLWTVNSGDYLNPGELFIQKKILRRTKNGSILLFHDSVEQTLNILPQVLQQLKQKGYKFVTLSELMREL